MLRKASKISTERLPVRLMIPRMATSSILDPKYVQYMKSKTDVDISSQNIIKSHELLPFDVLQCEDVPMNRLESFVVSISKLLNCKKIDQSFHLEYNYQSDHTLRTKFLFPQEFIKKLQTGKNRDEELRNFNSDRLIYIDNLQNRSETALHIKVWNQSLVLDHLKPKYWEFLRESTVEYTPFDEIDQDTRILSYQDVLKVLKNKFIIEYNSGCSIEIPKYHDNYNNDDLLEVKITGLNRYNTVKGIRMLDLYRST